MTTMPTARRAILGAAIAIAIGLAACSGATAPATTPAGVASASPPPSSDPPDRADPGGGGGGSPGNPGTGIGIAPVDPAPGGPGAGQPILVRPVPGRADPHPASPIALEASVDGRNVLVKITWYGGVEPCSVLDSVKVERTGADIAVTPFEGSSQANVACVDIALLKATIVDLGELDPGTYRISAPGSAAPPVVVTID